MPIAHEHLCAPSDLDPGPAQLSEPIRETHSQDDQIIDPLLGSSQPPKTSNELHSNLYTGRISPNETRQELIERIKRTRRKSLLNACDQSQDAVTLCNDKTEQKKSETNLLPAAELRERSSYFPSGKQSELAKPSDIQRPRSALHAGDFREQPSQAFVGSPRSSQRSQEQAWLSTSPTSPWYTASLPRKDYFRNQALSDLRPSPPPMQFRPRAASYTSRASSFAFLPPTSPLANESMRNEHVDSQQYRQQHSPDRTRRHTFSPNSLQRYRGLSMSTSRTNEALDHQRVACSRPNIHLPYQAHQPRRSLSSFSTAATNPFFETSSAHSRPLGASGPSPLQRLPMVGGYEESILRGRMSSLPSRPLDFVAQIGVLGRGKCKPSLKCPPHVTVPFPAVFYNYGNRPSSPTSSEGPSPYVGMIDLERNLGTSNRPDTSTTRRSDSPSRIGKNDDDDDEKNQCEQTPPNYRQRQARSDRDLHAAQTLPGGSYRIPQQGQIQIIIKSPNKTAVKLFLVAYDLTSMEAGQKTFIRQRSYSAGPIIDMPLDTRKNLGTDRPEAAISNADDPKDRPILRYLIHLNICCPSRGRYYLYKSIRVVFANRVPDGKEKLRQEIQLPEPRFSPYRPGQDPVSTPGSRRTSSSNPFRFGGAYAFERDGLHAQAPSRYFECDDCLPTNYFNNRSPQLRPSFSPGDCSPSELRTSNEGTCDVNLARAQGSNYALASTRIGIAADRGTLSDASHFRSDSPADRNGLDRRLGDVSTDDDMRPQTRLPRASEGLLAMQLRDAGGQCFR